MPIDFAFVRKEQQIGVRAGHKKVFDGIFVFGFGALKTFTTTPLCSVHFGGRPFDIAAVADRDDHRFFFDEILEIDVAQLFTGNFGAPLVGKFLFEIGCFVLDDVQYILMIRQDSHVLVDLVEQFTMLVTELLLLQVDQSTKCHAQDRVGLNCRERVHTGFTAFFLKDAKAFFAQGTLHHRRGTLDTPQ